MRKAILIAALIFCISSTAGAAHYFGGATEVSNTGTAVVTVVATDTNTFTSVVEELEGAITTIVATPKAGDDGKVTPLPGGYAWTIEARDSSFPMDSVETGIQFNITVSGAGFDVDDTFTIYMYNEAYTGTLDNHTVTVTPEPMTIGLLGLGSLLALRKKR